MECNFGNPAKIILPETQKILAQRPKVRKVLFLPEICPLECSTWREECLTDEPAVFLQIRVSSGKPPQNIKLYLLAKKIFIQIFFWSHGFCFWHPCWKLLPSIRNFFIQNQKRQSNLLFWGKELVCLKAFLWTCGMRCRQLRWECFGKKSAIFHSLAISQKDLVSANVFPRNAPLHWTRRMPYWRTCSFLAKQIFLTKTIKRFKIEFSSE